MEKTNYRLVNNGYVDFLEYEVTISLLFGLIKRRIWRRVWRPYYDRIWGRALDSSGYNGYVNGYEKELKDFIDGKWPYIDDYFKWANEEQANLVRKAKEKDNEVDLKRGIIKKL